MLKRLLNNWGLKLISLLLAFLLWFLVIEIGDPKDDRDMGNIQVKLINTDLLKNEGKVYEVLEETDTVRVSVYAPKSVFTQLRSSDITAEADISKLTDINTVPIEFSSSAANVVSITGSHNSVKLSIEDEEKKYVPLVCRTVGNVAEGYVVSGLTPDQNRIEVSGPKSSVDQIRSAGAQIDVTDATSNLTANVDILFYDVSGNVVDQSRISKNVDHVKMSVEILAVKEVPISFTVSGQPESGYMVAGEATSDVETVVLAGTQYTLSKISAVTVPEDVLDVTGATEDVIRTVDIREYLPDNTKLGDSDFGGKVTLTVPVEPIAEKTLEIPITNVQTINVPDGFSAQIMDSAETLLTLEVSGLQEKIDALSQDEIAGSVDIEAWMTAQKMEKLRSGNYTMPVTFRLDDEITVKNTAHVKVVIKEADQ